jgi:hypothetical protein
MIISKSEAIREIGFFIENGGINSHNCEHVHRIICEFGEDAHEVFQEAADQIATLVSSGIVSQADLVSTQTS